MNTESRIKRAVFSALLYISALLLLVFVPITYPLYYSTIILLAILLVLWNLNK